MADDVALSNLSDAIANIAALLKDATASPKPSYSVGGQSVSWSEYVSMLNQQMKTMLETRQILYGPFELRVQGVT